MKRAFLTDNFPLERVVTETRRALKVAVDDPSTLTLLHDVGAYLADAGVAVKRKRGSEYQTPQYALATRYSGTLTARAQAWMEINGLESEALEFNRAQIQRYVSAQSAQLRLRRQACVDEIELIDLDLNALKDMLNGGGVGE